MGGPSVARGDNLWRCRWSGRTIHGSHRRSGRTIYGNKICRRWSGRTSCGGTIGGVTAHTRQTILFSLKTQQTSDNNKHRPILVTFANPAERKQVLSNRSKLAGTKIYINFDLTKEQMNEEKDLGRCEGN